MQTPRPVYQSMDLSIHLHSIAASTCIIACNSQIILPPSCFLLFCYVWNPILSYVNAHPLILMVLASSKCYNMIWFAFTLWGEQNGWWGLHQIPKEHDIIEVRLPSPCIYLTHAHFYIFCWEKKQVRWAVTQSHISVFLWTELHKQTPNRGKSGEEEKGLQKSLSDEAWSPPGSDLLTFTENSFLLCCPNRIPVWMEAMREGEGERSVRYG